MDARHYKNKLITEWRDEAGVSQEKLAAELRVHRMTIFRAEKGLSASYELLARIATHFGKGVKDLLHPEPVVTPKQAVEPLVA